MLLKRLVSIFLISFLALSQSFAEDFQKIPISWKWLGNRQVIFSYDATFEDSTAFVIDAKTHRRKDGITSPKKFSNFPIIPRGSVNLTYSPDSTKLAYTKDNDLYVVDIQTKEETRLTFDGSDLILNGYASWVYYEEIFGRHTRYRAFWWSPDSKKIGFYRFDNSNVPLFPIYSSYEDAKGAASQNQSPKVTDLGLGGSLKETRYPKAGQENPYVSIGIVNLDSLNKGVVWADFDENDDQYFGTPFWGPDSKEFFVSRMPRLQNTLDLYSVNIEDGSKKHIYNENYTTWIDWITNVVFTDKGLYMVRNFETSWQQLYFLSYDGKQFKRLTSGTNWSMDVLKVDEKNGNVYFLAKRDATVRRALYVLDKKGVIKSLTDPAYNVSQVSLSPDLRYFVASYGNFTTPNRVALFETAKSFVSNGHNGDIVNANLRKANLKQDGYIISDMASPNCDLSKWSLPELVHITTPDGLTLPGMIQYPYDFDSSKQYPVHVDIYGGPDTPMVRDRWLHPSDDNQWYSRNGIIQITVDPRAGGHNGRKGLDQIYKNLTVNEVQDFISWAKYLQSLPYVKADKIGVEGFSFGGTMTAILLMKASEYFHYGIAGGGVYNWALYDTHYTERYMDTPANNPDGYAVSCALNYVESYPSDYQSNLSFPIEPVMLKITHGTGDDNVHFQNTLILVDALQKEGKKFEFMIYPDGMHGYRGYQGAHFKEANRAFWMRYLNSK